MKLQNGIGAEAKAKLRIYKNVFALCCVCVHIISFVMKIDVYTCWIYRASFIITIAPGQKNKIQAENVLAKEMKC